TSPDRTKYSAQFTTKLNRSELAEDLHQLSLPLLSDPLQEGTLVYSSADEILQNAEMRALVQSALSNRLNMLRFSAKDWLGLSPQDAGVLANPQGESVPRERVLSRQKAQIAIYIRFETLPPGEEKAEKLPGLRAVLVFYHRSSGAFLGQVEFKARHDRFSLPLDLRTVRRSLGGEVLEPLTKRLLPGVVSSPSSLAGSAPELQLRVLGLQSVEEEESFEQAFFRRGSQFERFSLQRIGSSDLVYAGPYSGNRLALESEWRGKTVGAFIVRDVYWQKDLLEFELERKDPPPARELILFPKAKRTPDANNAIESFFGRFAQLEVEDPLYAETEDNSWVSRANTLIFNATVYGFLDARSDSDFYVGEAMNPGEEVTLVWYRIGRSNLTPIVRIYNEQGTPVQSFYPRSWLSAKVKLPKGEHRFYMEIADRYGHLRMDTGGYLNLGYLFKIVQSGSGPTAAN
ncbi:MAG: hypothetical protein OEW39_06985, partial [Deltaproteobacteria bacterium]|nr:hypothetical protein [Deltaproteobacteria bacterium]